MSENSHYIIPRMEMLAKETGKTPDFIIDQGSALKKSVHEVFADSYI